MATLAEPERGVLPKPTPTAAVTLQETTAESVASNLTATPAPASQIDPAQHILVPTETYFRGRMPDNLLSTRNADILEFGRLVSPETAGMKEYMHKLLLQDRVEEWASATEESLCQVTEQFYSVINSTADKKIQALHVECRTGLCYVDLPHDSYAQADRLRRGGDRRADLHIYALIGKEGEPFYHQLVENGVGTNYENENVTRWILAFDRGEATAAIYANSPPPG
ncbi:hypothetical protein HPT27_18935 [Permianibacter sp. IMCC34836]|uniref:hypothetical protein n=1 Tax=Permianibacter fluminis TaxID=2738515 RepID=UPI00155398E8|nr:hypothetical protein [Permianibacter fluminis]NQD39098.1 hypothetical protein [Permianibacter fluminis]